VVCAGIETTADTAAELGPDTVQRIVERLGSHRWGLMHGQQVSLAEAS